MLDFLKNTGKLLFSFVFRGAVFSPLSTAFSAALLGVLAITGGAAFSLLNLALLSATLTAGLSIASIASSINKSNYASTLAPEAWTSGESIQYNWIETLEDTVFNLPKNILAKNASKQAEIKKMDENLFEYKKETIQTTQSTTALKNNAIKTIDNDSEYTK